MCQPGRPGVAMPAGDGHAGSPGFEGFHSTKSMRIPLIAVIGWWFYGEPLDVFVFLGAGLIITGILWNLRSEAARAIDPTKPVLEKTG